MHFDNIYLFGSASDLNTARLSILQHHIDWIGFLIGAYFWVLKLTILTTADVIETTTIS